MTTASRIDVEVARTTYGVPHVRAKDFRSLGYGLAYAYAQDNVCMFADTVLTVRGERSQFFGGEARAPQRTGDEYGAASGFMDLKNEDSDFFFRGYLDIEQLRANYAAGPPSRANWSRVMSKATTATSRPSPASIRPPATTPSGCARSRSTTCT